MESVTRRVRASKASKTEEEVSILEVTCFGHLFDLTQSECQYCALQHLCGRTNFNKINKAEDTTLYLDESKLPTLDRAELAAKYANKPYFLFKGEVKRRGNVIDSLADAYCKALLTEYSLTVQNGVIKNG